MHNVNAQLVQVLKHYRCFSVNQYRVPMLKFPVHFDDLLVLLSRNCFTKFQKALMHKRGRKLRNCHDHLLTKLWIRKVQCSFNSLTNAGWHKGLYFHSIFQHNRKTNRWAKTRLFFNFWPNSCHMIDFDLDPQLCIITLKLYSSPRNFRTIIVHTFINGSLPTTMLISGLFRASWNRNRAFPVFVSKDQRRIGKFILAEILWTTLSEKLTLK